MQAFGRAQAAKGNEPMVFDWDRAAQILKDNSVQNAQAGLEEDWEYTGGDILVDGKIPKKSYTFLSSTWARPQLQYQGELINCYKMRKDTPNWSSEIFWPDSARKIFES